jgi:hypothetical protein
LVPHLPHITAPSRLGISGVHGLALVGRQPSVPLTVSPLNPEAQGGDRRAASGSPVVPDLRNNSVRWSPGVALSARGLTVWLIRQAALLV